MNIVYLVNSRWPVLRGAERLLLSQCEYGLTHGHEITVLAPEGSAVHGACRRIGVRSDVVDFGPAPWSLAHLGTVLRGLRPDVVHGMSIFPVALVRVLRLLPLDGSVRFFAYVSVDPSSSVHVRATAFRRPLFLLRNLVSRMEAADLDGIFVPAETLGRQLSKAGIPGRVIVIPGIIDVERLEREAGTPLSMHPAPGSPRIGYAGFLNELKGVDHLIRAFAQLAEKHPSASLLLAGEGPERERLLCLARDLGVGDRVHFPGFIEPIAPFLALLDVFASPSLSEARGRTIAEALALGVPCVCTDVGGVSEIVRNESTGLLVPAGDSAALAAGISRLLDDPDLAARLREGGRSLAGSAQYSLSTTLETVFGEYVGAAASETAI